MNAERDKAPNKMNKIKKALLVLIPVLAISACTDKTSSEESKQQGSSSNTQITEKDKTTKYDIEITLDNLWYYFDYSISKTTTTAYYSVKCEFKGLLSYAYYENVVVKLEYKAVRGGEFPKTYTAQDELKLNAAGSGTKIYAYDYIPENATPKVSESDLYGFDRSAEIVGVEGKVRFAI